MLLIFVQIPVLLFGVGNIFAGLFLLVGGFPSVPNLEPSRLILTALLMILFGAFAVYQVGQARNWVSSNGIGRLVGLVPDKGVLDTVYSALCTIFYMVLFLGGLSVLLSGGGCVVLSAAFGGKTGLSYPMLAAGVMLLYAGVIQMVFSGRRVYAICCRMMGKATSVPESPTNSATEDFEA